MERIAQNTPNMARQAGTDEHGDKRMIIYESHNNPNVHHDLELWQRVCDYDKANVELPLMSYLGNRNIRLGNNFRLVSRRQLKSALREDPLQVINEFSLL